MSSETTSPSLSPEAALALLELPPLDGLTQEQVRGASCIWCDTPLATETAVDLGERRHKRLGGGRFSTFPRACRDCVHDAAKDAFWAHPGCCEQCADDAAMCETATALRSLIREYQR